MHASTFELMHEHIRSIYRALTGADLPDSATDAPSAAPLSPDAVARRFADLDAAARTIARVAERVPPFSFAPPLDAIDTERELVIEVGVPGVEKHDVAVELHGGELTVDGSRPGEREVNGRTYLHAELPRGPFHRVVRLPYPVAGEARVEVTHGLIRVRLTKPVKAAPAKA
jgi:HSP20 family molecular chaperone IbpA